MSLEEQAKYKLEVFITAEAPLHVTESREKVEKALSTFIDGPFELDKRSTGLFLVGVQQGLESLEKFKQVVKKFQIEPMIRSRLIHSIMDDITTLYMNKQAAYVGKIALLDVNEDPPLGMISFSIVSNDLMQVIDWLVPLSERRSKRKARKREKGEA